MTVPTTPRELNMENKYTQEFQDFLKNRNKPGAVFSRPMSNGFFITPQPNPCRGPGEIEKDKAKEKPVQYSTFQRIYRWLYKNYWGYDPK